MCWEKQWEFGDRAILSHLNSSGCYAFLSFLHHSTRVEYQRNTVSAMWLQSYTVLGWKKLMLWRKTPAFPMWCLLEDKGRCSKMQNPFPAPVWSCICPVVHFQPLNTCQEHLTSVTSVFSWCVLMPLTLTWEGSASSMELKWLLGNKYPNPSSREIFLHGYSFSGLGHHVLCVFLQNPSKQLCNTCFFVHSTEREMGRAMCSMHGIVHGEDS